MDRTVVVGQRNRLGRCPGEAIGAAGAVNAISQAATEKLQPALPIGFGNDGAVHPARGLRHRPGLALGLPVRCQWQDLGMVMAEGSICRKPLSIQLQGRSAAMSTLIEATQGAAVNNEWPQADGGSQKVLSDEQQRRVLFGGSGSLPLRRDQRSAPSSPAAILIEDPGWASLLLRTQGPMHLSSKVLLGQGRWSLAGDFIAVSRLSFMPPRCWSAAVHCIERGMVVSGFTEPALDAAAGIVWIPSSAGPQRNFPGREPSQPAAAVLSLERQNGIAWHFWFGPQVGISQANRCPVCGGHG